MGAAGRQLLEFQLFPKLMFHLPSSRLSYEIDDDDDDGSHDNDDDDDDDDDDNHLAITEHWVASNSELGSTRSGCWG